LLVLLLCPLVKDQTVFILDDTDAEKCVQVEVPLKQILTDKDESSLKDTMAFSTLSSSADLQEEIVDIEEYDTGANRINQDLQREADEEMSGFPVDFVARKNSVPWCLSVNSHLYLLIFVSMVLQLEHIFLHQCHLE
jgi:hypothetical protein